MKTLTLFFVCFALALSNNSFSQTWDNEISATSKSPLLPSDSLTNKRSRIQKIGFKRVVSFTLLFTVCAIKSSQERHQQYRPNASENQLPLLGMGLGILGLFNSFNKDEIQHRKPKVERAKMELFNKNAKLLQAASGRDDQ